MTRNKISNFLFNIAELRVEVMGQTISEVARDLNVSRPTLSQLLNKRKKDRKIEDLTQEVKSLKRRLWVWRILSVVMAIIFTLILY